MERKEKKKENKKANIDEEAQKDNTEAPQNIVL